jgi:hypothetical protein
MYATETARATSSALLEIVKIVLQKLIRPDEQRESGETA